MIFALALSPGFVTKEYNDKKPQDCLVYAITRAINDSCLNKDVRVDYCWLLDRVTDQIRKKFPSGLSSLNSSKETEASNILIANKLADEKIYVAVCSIKPIDKITDPTESELFKDHKQFQVSINSSSKIKAKHLIESHEQLQLERIGNKMCLFSRESKYFLYTYNDSVCDARDANDRKIYHVNLKINDITSDQDEF